MYFNLTKDLILEMQKNGFDLDYKKFIAIYQQSKISKEIRIKKEYDDYLAKEEVKKEVKKKRQAEIKKEKLAKKKLKKKIWK